MKRDKVEEIANIAKQENQKALSVEGVVEEFGKKAYDLMYLNDNNWTNHDVLELKNWLRKTIADRDRAWQNHTDRAKEIGFKLGLKKALNKEDEE